MPIRTTGPRFFFFLRRRIGCSSVPSSDSAWTARAVPGDGRQVGPLRPDDLLDLRRRDHRGLDDLGVDDGRLRFLALPPFARFGRQRHGARLRDREGIGLGRFDLAGLRLDGEDLAAIEVGQRIDLPTMSGCRLNLVSQCGQETTIATAVLRIGSPGPWFHSKSRLARVRPDCGVRGGHQHPDLAAFDGSFAGIFRRGGHCRYPERITDLQRTSRAAH